MKPKVVKRKPRKTSLLKAETKQIVRSIRRGNKLFIKIAEATGIPEAYSASVAWFAERVFLAALCLIALSFALGAIFVLRWSQPIADSDLYDTVSAKAHLAQQGIKVYSQQVIDVASPVFYHFVQDNREVAVPLEQDQADQLAARESMLKTYLQSKNSPFADDDKAIAAFAQSKNMKLMIAISFVESTYGKHCYYYNCSGIGGTPPNLRKYNSYEEWIADFDQLLEDRYKDVSPDKFIGLYVQPGSPNWIFGVHQVLQEFTDMGM